MVHTVTVHLPVNSIRNLMKYIVKETLEILPTNPSTGINATNKDHSQWGAWVAQPVKHHHDPRVLGLSPALGSLLSRESASPSLSSLSLLVVLALSQIKSLKIKKTILKSINKILKTSWTQEL